jgi:hypothetical protein
MGGENTWQLDGKSFNKHREILIIQNHNLYSGYGVAAKSFLGTMEFKETVIP